MWCAFTCAGWQVTLCDPIWQVTLRSCETHFDFFKKFCGLTFTQNNMVPVMLLSVKLLVAILAAIVYISGNEVSVYVGHRSRVTLNSKVGRDRTR